MKLSGLTKAINLTVRVRRRSVLNLHVEFVSLFFFSNS
jgi:hypothetical protein